MSTIVLNRERTQVQSPPFSIPNSAEAGKWTDVKTKRVWASVFAALAFSGAAASTALAFTVSLWLLAPVVPLLVASGALIWYCCTSIDYDSAAELAKAREQAKNLPLLEIVTQHGWEKIFRYTILTPEQFETQYCALAQTLSLLNLVSVYEESETGLCSAKRKAANLEPFFIPEPKNWKEKFEKETAAMSCSQILSSYFYGTSLQKLYLYEILSKEAFGLFSEADLAISQFSRNRSDCEIEFEKRTWREADVRERYKNIAHLSYDQRIHEIDTPFWDEWQKDRMRDDASRIRNLSYELADQQFKQSTMPVRLEIDAKIAQYEREKEGSLAKINERYALLRLVNSQ